MILRRIFRNHREVYHTDGEYAKLDNGALSPGNKFESNLLAYLGSRDWIFHSHACTRAHAGKHLSIGECGVSNFLEMTQAGCLYGFVLDRLGAFVEVNLHRGNCSKTEASWHGQDVSRIFSGTSFRHAERRPLSQW